MRSIAGFWSKGKGDITVDTEVDFRDPQLDTKTHTCVSLHAALHSAPGVEQMWESGETPPSIWVPLKLAFTKLRVLMRPQTTPRNLNAGLPSPEEMGVSSTTKMVGFLLVFLEPHPNKVPSKKTSKWVHPV